MIQEYEEDDFEKYFSFYILGLLGDHIGIMLAPRATGLWFDPPINL